MKIIQSFAQFDDGNHYVINNIKNNINGTEIYLNFYTFYLSFLTLKKYYGAVTMYCNRVAYDTFIKYIPYDEIIIKENKHTQKFWSAYKLDVIDDMTEDFIHVDSDVFIFDDVFRPFIDNIEYDIMIQFVFDNSNDKNYYYNNICSSDIYDFRAFTCGVLGMRINIKDSYIKDTNEVFDMINNNQIPGNNFSFGFILEELTLYLNMLKNNLKWFAVIPEEDIINLGLNEACEKHKYTHMWFDSKFKEQNINLIKNKIRKDFPTYYNVVDKYENDLSDLNIKLNYIPEKK